MSDRSTLCSQGLSGSLQLVPRLAHGKPNRERDQDENAGIEIKLALVQRILVPLIFLSQLGSFELRSYSSQSIHHREMISRLNLVHAHTVLQVTFGRLVLICFIRRETEPKDLIES